MKISFRQAQEQSEHTELLGSPRVMIEPYSSWVDRAVNIVNAQNPELLKNVSDVRLNLSKGVIGEYQTNNPSTIWININKLESDVRAKMNGQSQEVIDNEIINQIAETIVHEATHRQEFGETGHSSEVGAERAEEDFRQKLSQR